jgi:SAM-dependent MidA family methyltransferase
MDLALYGEGGFFASGHGAGRSGRDFVTSVELGSLFGALIARALDREWEALGRPDPFVVIEVGAGSGRLAREVVRATPTCAPALRLLLVERSPMLRAEQARSVALVAPEVVLGGFGPADDLDVPPEPEAGVGPLVASLDDLPAVRIDGVVLANELLDNLVFGVLERTPTGWAEVRVGLDGDTFVEVLVECPAPDTFGVDVPVGARMPVDRALSEWVRRAARCVRRGSVLLVDYLVPMRELVERSPDWLRTYAAHARGASPLAAPGSCDITADVVIEQLERAATRAGLRCDSVVTQAEWLGELGIDALVAEARATWAERAHLGDLPALMARSRINEAAALTDPAGLGAFAVARLAP